MFKNLKKKFAKVALVALALQLAVIGLGVNPGTIKAAENVSTKSVTISSVIPASFIAGKTDDITLTVDNLHGLDYEDVNAKITILGADEENIASLSTTVNGSLVDLLPAFTENTFGLTTDYAIGDLTGTFTKSYNFQVVFNTPGSYSLEIVLTDILGNRLASHTPAFKVAENIALSTTLLANVKLGTEVPFTATLDNTYGLTHDISAVLTVKDSLADSIDLDYGLTEIAFVQVGADSVATIPGRIIAGTPYTLTGLSLTLSTERVYGYTLQVFDVSNLVTPIATTFGSVFADGSAPVVTMTSKPVIVSNVDNGLEVTFTANENISESAGNAVMFTQVGATPYSGTLIAQTDKTILVVSIPANKFVVGVAPILVAGQFSDLVGNVLEFTGQIQVDTIAPVAVTGVTTFVNADGSVTITWVNPPAGTYTGIRLVRVGDYTITLAPGVTSYTDYTTVRGQTYSYSVVAFDGAGNETVIPAIPVTVVAPVVAAAVSDTFVPESTPSDVATDLTANTNSEEVKANVIDDTSSKSGDDSGFPLWGIILLVLLAAVGAYLIWNQKPAVAPVVATKKKTNIKK